MCEPVNCSKFCPRELDRLPLSRLAQAMNSSCWQLEQLCKIKMNLLFRLLRAIFLCAEQFACCNLYSYVDIEKMAKENEIVSRDADGDAADDRFGTIAPERWLSKLLADNELKFGRHRRPCTYTISARVYLSYYVISVILLTRSIYSQYKYDFYHYHLLRYQKATAATNSSLASYNSSELANNQQILNIYERHRMNETELVYLQAQARAETSARSGSFLLDQAFFAECCYILMILLSMFVYFGPLVYYRLVRGAYDFYFIRMLLDWDLEQVNCNQMIQRQVETVAKSSEVFTRISLNQLQSFATEGGAAMHFRRHTAAGPAQLGWGHDRRTAAGGQNKGRPPVPRPPLIRLTIGELLTRESDPRPSTTTRELECLYRMEHRWLERRLKWMALDGQLQPLDRCDIRQIVNSIMMQVAFVCFICPACYIWNICLFGSLPRIFNFAYDTSWASIGSMLWLGGMNVALTYAGVYYFSTCLVYCKTQVLIVNKLRRMIGEFLQLNRALMLARSSEKGRDNNTLNTLLMITSDGCQDDNLLSGGCTCTPPINEYELINSRLLLLVMHYKIFVVQLRHTKTTFSYLLMAAFGLMFIFPILARLHSPYLTVDGAKTLIIIVCLIMVGLPDMVVIPIAWSNARSSALYKDLASLLAHLIEWQGNLRPNERTFYNEHTLWLLRRELQHPENFRHQFAIRAFSIEFSYKELVKIHFWLGLIIITFGLDFQQATPGGDSANGGDTSSFGRWLTDPLGIAGSFN